MSRVSVVGVVAMLAMASSGCDSCDSKTEPPRPAARATASSMGADRKAECAALLSRLEQSNRTGVEFGIANKADGGDLTSLWRGFARLAGDDARAPTKATDPVVARYERRFVDIRSRSVPAFEDLAAATEKKDPALEQVAGTRIAALREEWSGLERDLRAGCPATD